METAHLRRVIEAHTGNLSSCAREIGVSRQVLTRRLAVITLDFMDEDGKGYTITLLAYAERLRAAAGIKGPRSTHSDVTDQEERSRLIDAIARAGGYRPAAEMLGLSPSTVVRRIKKHGITVEDVAAHRQQMDGSSR